MRICRIFAMSNNSTWTMLRLFHLHGGAFFMLVYFRGTTIQAYRPLTTL
nr:MAG TPA: hypothetical protein [Caudoviricetes sp.]DAX82586.1 MAG TPA: hypothetical protein [Caudoviricetes sp.]